MTGIARSLVPFSARRPCQAGAPHPAGRFPVAGQGTLAILNNAVGHQAHLSFQERWTLRCCLGCASPPPVCMGQHGCVQGGLHSAHCHACKLPHAALLSVLQLMLLHVAGATAHDTPGAPACAAPSHPAVAAAAAAFLHRRAAGAQAPQRSTSWFLPLRVGCLQVQRREAASAWL